MEDSERKKLEYKMQTLSDIREVLMELHLGSKDSLLKELVEYYNKVETDYINGVATAEEIDAAINKFYPTIDEAVEVEHDRTYR